MQHELFRVLLVPILVLGTTFPAAAQSAGTPTPPALLNANGASDTAPDDEVALDMDTSGRAVAVFTAVDPLDGDLDIHMTYSLDHGASWTPSGPASPAIANAIGDEIEPTVSSQVGGWRYAYAKNTTSGGEHDIWWGATSGNPGFFSNNGVLQSDGGGDTFDDRLPCLASAGPTAATSTSICVWQRESAAGDEDLCFARFDGGSSIWSPTAFLHASFASDVGRDRFPRVAGDGAGNWVCVWHSTNDLGGTIGTDNDVLVSRSSDDGVTWSAPVALNSTAATDGTSSDLSPAIAVDAASGTWLVVWQSTNSLGGTIGIDNDVFVARSTDAGATWSAVVPLNTDAATDQLGVEDNDNFVDVAVDGSGRFVTVWQRGDSPPTEYDIRRATSTDLGVTWTAPELVNTNGATDTGADSEPRIAAGPDGHWIVAWNSRDDLGGTIGTDLDVLGSRFFAPDSSSPSTEFCFGFDHGGVRCPCGNDSVPTARSGCMNSTGFGSRAHLNGTARIAGPSCRVLASGMPPNASALVFQGTSAVNLGEGVPFGDGLRCVGGAVLRIDTVTVSSAGQVNVVMPTTGLAAGDQRCYQVWYRNAQSFCTASTFNLSSAFWVVWLP